MQVMHSAVGGLDIHKAVVVGCAMKTADNGKVTKETVSFGTTTPELLRLGDWLKGHEIKIVAMESTGSYWKPIYNILEGQVELMVVNAHHIKAVPGRKTDVKDAEWIAELLRHGLIKGSFVPDKPQRELRELVRHRNNQVDRRAQCVNELQRTLESTNIKLGNVVTDITGKSALEMLQAMLAGNTNPEALAEMARGRLKEKKPLLREALQGRVDEHHRLILAQLLADISNYEEHIVEAGVMIEQRLEAQQDLLDRLDEIPGINQRVAQIIAAEVGTEVSRFPTAENLISWAGICPGLNQSGGKRKNGHIKAGNISLRRAVVEAANAASRKKDCYLSAMYRRLAARKGRKRALVAVARTILQICYYLIKRGTAYQDLGADYFDRRNPEHLANKLAKRIEKLGFTVELKMVQQTA